MMVRVVSSIAVLSLVAFGSVLGLRVEAGLPLEVVSADRDLGSANTDIFMTHKTEAQSALTPDAAIRPILEMAEEKVARNLASKRQQESPGSAKRRHYSRTTPE